MQEALAYLFSYIWGVWRHRWIALVLAWVTALVGWAYVWQMPESYVASARLFVDTNSVLRPLLRGLAITPDIDQRIGMMSRTLLSRPNLETLIRMTDLDLQVTTEAEKEAMIARMKDSIKLSGDRNNASLYSISVRDNDRETARRVTQSLVTVFIESSLNEKREDSSGAQSFLDEQIQDYEQRLIEAENRLARFKQRHVDILPGGGGDYYSRLQAVRSDLQDARLQLQEAQNRRSELQRQIEGEDPLFVAVNGSSEGSMSPLDSRIQSLKVQMDQLLSRYTDKHPEVRQIRGLIEELEKEREAEYLRMLDQSRDSASQFSGLSSSPVYQGMRSMLAETEARVAELQVRVAEFERRAEDLEAKVNSIPQVEAELKQLDRDYSVIARQHQEMLRRRESARISEDVENNASDVSFRVIDPPFVPLQPNDPNKPLLNAGVLVLALGVGVGGALLLSLLYPMVTDARMLANATGMPLLGVVTNNKASKERTRDNLRLAGFSACGLLLLVAFAGVSLAPGLWL